MSPFPSEPTRLLSAGRLGLRVRSRELLWGCLRQATERNAPKPHCVCYERRVEAEGTDQPIRCLRGLGDANLQGRALEPGKWNSLGDFSLLLSGERLLIKPQGGEK